ncbi:hypothetical protein ACHAWT_010254 [Skeletonema menzelii]
MSTALLTTTTSYIPNKMDGSDDDEATGVGKGGGKSRRELPAGAVAILKAWLLSPEHFTHPYPTPQDQIMLMEKTGIDKKQLKNWFTNARRRIWKPMLKKQLEAGKLAAGGASGGGVGQGGPGMAVQLPAAVRQQQQQAPQQEMYSNFQQAQIQSDAQYQPQQVQYQEQPIYNTDQQYSQQPYQQQQESFQVSNSIGSLQPMNPVGSTASFGNQMIKTDSHAVLMELFARDQDLVRQAASSKSGGGGVATQPAAAVGGGNNGLQASGQSGNLRWAAGTAPAAAQGSGGMGQRQHSVTFAGDSSNMPASSSFASWPHFSSVSSLSNLGGLQGVKSITNLSAADLSSQGNLNKMGNLAQVKSVENLQGRGDSFAFLEVFFDDKSGLTNGQRGVKREREEDDAIGLSLDDNEAASPMARPPPSSDTAMPKAGVPTPAPLPLDGEEENADEGDGRQLKRAYDDALAARGLIAVRKSCENLNNLDLPAKMQKTLSMEYMHKHAQGQNLGNFFSTENSSFAPNASPQRMGRSGSQNFPSQQQSLAAGVVGDPINASVEVPSSTACALCTTVNVDTQLRPCGHMFHGRCLKPSLQTASGPPQCPICSTPMQSAILAVPSASSGGEVA